jgi:hypothetical protein
MPRGTISPPSMVSSKNCRNRGADFLGAAALDDGGHLTGGGILDRNAGGLGIRGPSER